MPHGTIILGYDGSPCSGAALREAIGLARDLDDGEIVLIWCEEPPPGLSGDLDRACDAAYELREWERATECEIGPLLRQAADRIKEAGVPVDVRLLFDDPVRALAEAATESGSRAIVVGSRGEGPFKATLHRSTPLELQRRSSVPVLVVPYRD